MEASHFVQKWKRGPAYFYKGKNQDLFITGVGIFQAATACGFLAHEKHELWINAGLAGSLKRDLTEKSLCAVSSVDALSYQLPFGKTNSVLKLNTHNTTIFQKLKADLAEQNLGDFAKTQKKELEKTKMIEDIKLLTLPFALHDPKQRDELSKKADLVDMEGYAIAHTAIWAGISVEIYKVVSDFCKKDDSQRIIKELPSYMGELLKFLQEKEIFLA